MWGSPESGPIVLPLIQNDPVAKDHQGRVHPLRTALAAQGVHLSALFFAVFENTRLPGTPKRQPRLMAPPGPSTGGGKMARQSLTLVPEEGAEGSSVVVGWADSSTKRAELRSWSVVADAFRERFAEDLDIPVGPYNRFIDKAGAFFREQDFAVDRVDERQTTVPEPPAEPKDRGLWLLWVLVVLAALAVGIGLGVLFMVLSRGAQAPPM